MSTMDLTKLFERQQAYENCLIREKGLAGQDLLARKVLALQVGIGKLANEWRGFKYWSEDQEPRRGKQGTCPKCNGSGQVRYYTSDNCEDCGGSGSSYHGNPLLNAYVDCLQFVLSLGLECRTDWSELQYATPGDLGDVITQFSCLFSDVEQFYEVPNRERFRTVWRRFIGLGQTLSFNWEEIEQAYLSKSTKNYAQLNKKAGWPIKKVTTYFEISPAAAMAYNFETDKPTSAYVKVSTAHKRTLSPDEIEALHKAHTDYVIEEFEIPLKYLRAISADEYNLHNEDGEPD